MSELSPEATGRKFSQQWYEAEPGKPYHTVAELVAAAIREDRAEPVSEAEVEAGAVALREYDPCTFHNSAYNRTKFRADIRMALEAARKARAGK